MSPMVLPFPETLRVSRSNLNNLFRRVSATRNDPRYEIAIPDGWVVLAESPWQGDLAKRFSPLASYGTPQAGIDVVAARVGREVNPSDWLDIALREGGEQIRDCREYGSTGGWTSDVLTTNGRLCRRSLSSKTGDIVWVVSAWADLVSYPRLADTLYVCLSSFHSLEQSPQNDLQTEARAGVSFRYPQGWILTWEDAAARLGSSHEGVLAGTIIVEWTHGTSVERLLEQHLESLELDGLALLPADPMAVEPARGLSVDSAVCVATQAIEDGSELEVMAMAIAVGPYAAIVSLVSPARSASPEWWAINKRAWEIVAGTLRLNPKGGS